MDELEKIVKVIPPKPEFSEDGKGSMRPKRVAAYCRVSTDKEEQEHSFETQKEMYTEMIMMKPNWQMAGIYADEGITGTLAEKRPGFMKMIEDCRKDKIDMVITKSISRFSRNNLDCLVYIRELKQLGIPVIFEKEGINTLQVSSELLITLFSGISQAESESISMNVKMGIRQSLKNGNVPFSYKYFLGYRKGEDGNPEIVPEEAEIIKRIFAEYIAGKTLRGIADGLTADKVQTPGGKEKWVPGRIRYILKNEKYKGDALLQKSFTIDCISKKRKKNTGELPMYYVENSHPAIIDKETFDKAQEEMAKRNSKNKRKQTGTVTELCKYSGKYALSEILYCGYCGTPYRRCTWAKKGKKKIVWRCISRIEFGKKYCTDSPSIEESDLQNAIAQAITQKAKMENLDTERICSHIELYLSNRDKKYILSKKQRIREIEKYIEKITKEEGAAAQNGDYDDVFAKLYKEKYALEDEIEEEESKEKTEINLDSADNFNAVIDAFKNHPVEYDDAIVRQLIDCIKVMPEGVLEIYFKDGTQITEHI